MVDHGVRKLDALSRELKYLPDRFSVWCVPLLATWTNSLGTALGHPVSRFRSGALLKVENVMVVLGSVGERVPGLRL
jgi:hypothetical protein